jgi:hypothetical protein
MTGRADLTPPTVASGANCGVIAGQPSTVVRVRGPSSSTGSESSLDAPRLDRPAVAEHQRDQGAAARQHGGHAHGLLLGDVAEGLDPAGHDRALIVGRAAEHPEREGAQAPSRAGRSPPRGSHRACLSTAPPPLQVTVVTTPSTVRASSPVAA